MGDIGQHLGHNLGHFSMTKPDDFIEVSISISGAEAKHQLRLFAVQRILELLSGASGRPLERVYVENTILEEFRSNRGWHPDLDAAIKRRNITHAQNMIHWARGDLASDGILVKSKTSKGLYFLQCQFDQMIRYYQHERLSGFERVAERGNLRKRKSSYLKDSDSVYIIADDRIPGWLKIGAGRGDCFDRLTEAKRWTQKRARLLYILYIGSGYGLKVETAAHQLLKTSVEKQLEWFRCSQETAIEAIKRGAEKVRAHEIVEASIEELSYITERADLEVESTG